MCRLERPGSMVWTAGGACKLKLQLSKGCLSEAPKNHQVVTRCKSDAGAVQLTYWKLKCPRKEGRTRAQREVHVVGETSRNVEVSDDKGAGLHCFMHDLLETALWQSNP